MRYICFLLVWVPLAALGADNGADPYSRLTDQEFDYNEALEVPWVEIETQVREGPADVDLTELEIQHLPPGMRLFAGLKGLNVDKRDHVARLWLVVRSSEGAYNGSYEGFRCATGEYKVYAYYNPKRSTALRTVKLPRWRDLGSSAYRNELAREVLCSNTTPRDPDVVRLKPQHEAADYVAPYE